MAVRPSRRSAEDDGPRIEGLRLSTDEPVNKEWHVEFRPNPFSPGGTEFSWRLRDEKGWFVLWTKQKDAWSKAR